MIIDSDDFVERVFDYCIEKESIHLSEYEVEKLVGDCSPILVKNTDIILKHFKNVLENEISSEKDAFHFNFLLSGYCSGKIKCDDIVELRGYYKGLKTAREMLERAIAIAEEIGNE